LSSKVDCAIFIAHCGNQYSAFALKSYLHPLVRMTIWLGRCCQKNIYMQSTDSIKVLMKTTDSLGPVLQPFFQVCLEYSLRSGKRTRERFFGHISLDTYNFLFAVKESRESDNCLKRMNGYQTTIASFQNVRLPRIRKAVSRRTAQIIQ
jgi:hypothetical protein